MLKADRDHQSGLWLAPMVPENQTHPPTKTNANVNMIANVYAMRTKTDLVKYLHSACFSPCVQTWCDAIDLGYFSTFPGLTTTLVQKHLPKSIATAKGHLKKQRQHIRSTRPMTTERHIMTAEDYPPGPNAQTNLVTFKTVTDYEPTHTVATDQTG